MRLIILPFGTDPEWSRKKLHGATGAPLLTLGWLSVPTKGEILFSQSSIPGLEEEHYVELLQEVAYDCLERTPAETVAAGPRETSG